VATASPRVHKYRVVLSVPEMILGGSEAALVPLGHVEGKISLSSSLLFLLIASNGGSQLAFHISLNKERTDL
jgi:hypothetical protein